MRRRAREKLARKWQASQLDEISPSSRSIARPPHTSALNSSRVTHLTCVASEANQDRHDARFEANR
jgi:hypothetical protein